MHGTQNIMVLPDCIEYTFIKAKAIVEEVRSSNEDTIPISNDVAYEVDMKVVSVSSDWDKEKDISLAQDASVEEILLIVPINRCNKQVEVGTGLGKVYADVGKRGLNNIPQMPRGGTDLMMGDC
eukprot:Gb_13852 [translate_table: standard]